MKMTAREIKIKENMSTITKNKQLSALALVFSEAESRWRNCGGIWHFMNSVPAAYLWPADMIFYYGEIASSA